MNVARFDNPPFMWRQNLKLFLLCIHSQTACGSLSNLLKIRGNQKTDMPDNLQQPTASANESDSANNGNQSNNIDVALDNLETITDGDVKVIKESTTSLQQKMTCQFDKLDAMLNKAENAQYSMSHQNKQMKKFLK